MRSSVSSGIHYNLISKEIHMDMTRTVNLWLANDRHLYFATRDAAREFGYSSVSPELEDMIREIVEQNMTFQDGGTLQNDLLTSALAEVNWREIAMDFWTDYRDEDAA